MRRSVTITLLPDPAFLQRLLKRNLAALVGLGILALAAALAASLASWTVDDPSLSHATDGTARNVLGFGGAVVSDLAMQFLGLGSVLFLLPPVVWAWRLVTGTAEETSLKRRIAAWIVAMVLAAGAVATLPVPSGWPLPTGLGGVTGDIVLYLPVVFLGAEPAGIAAFLIGLVFAAGTVLLGFVALGRGVAGEAEELAEPAAKRGRRAAALEDDDDDYEYEDEEERDPLHQRVWSHLVILFGAAMHFLLIASHLARRLYAHIRSLVASIGEEERYPEERWTGARAGGRIEPSLDGAPYPGEDEAGPAYEADDYEAYDDELVAEEPATRVAAPAPKLKPGRRVVREAQRSMLTAEEFELPPLHLLAEPKAVAKKDIVSPEALEQNARLLEGVLEDFGVRGEIINIRPGPVVTLYELEPAPGIKSSRVIGLADDLARSMSAIACRVAVIPGKNAIGIELPNVRRETVFLRELLASEDFEKTKSKLALCLGKNIGGEPVIADLARMPHLLVAGTTGSGKSVSINTMILSLLYRMSPQECRMIMIDPKMLELSTYDGIPHLLTPVVTDPRKAVVALKWTVREMEDRYRKMSKLGVRNIDGFNSRVAEAEKKRERIVRRVQTGFDRETGEPIFEEEELQLEPMPYIVVIIDEMADLMMVAGKDIEGAVQRLAQMARAAGIHVVMATQRPSVDVITGTIKANFPTRISFQVTSKIDSRTILGEQGAEQLLGQGDMLYMVGGGRILRVHGPFVSDEEVDQVVAHLKSQGVPEYLESITEDDSEDAEFNANLDEINGAGSEGTLYDQAVAVVLRDKKASTSYIQRRLQIGYNRAASIIEKMEQEGLVGPADHAGRREILVGEEG